MSVAASTTAPIRPARVRPANSRASKASVDGAQLAELTYYRGRVALAAILKALGVGTGDEVVVQAFTCVAVPEGVMATGATPVYADIEPDGYNIDPAELEARLSPRTKAIVVQHTFGIPAAIDRIAAVAKAAGVAVIEDCCHAFGSTYDGQPLGSFGAASFYSFEWGKPIVAGLGGSAIANDPQLYDKLKTQYSDYQTPAIAKRVQLELQYRAFGLLYQPAWYWQVRSAFHALSRLGAAAGNFAPTDKPVGPSPEFSLRMSPRMAKRVNNKAQQLPALRQHANQVAECYRDSIRGAEHPATLKSASICYARYPLRVANKPALLTAARKARVELADWYRTVIHPLEAEQLQAVHYELGSCPRAESRAAEIVSLPTSKRVHRRYIDRVAQLLNNR